MLQFVFELDNSKYIELFHLMTMLGIGEMAENQSKSSWTIIKTLDIMSIKHNHHR